MKNITSLTFKNLSRRDKALAIYYDTSIFFATEEVVAEHQSHTDFV